MRRAAKVDSTHGEIRDALRDLGLKVWDCSKHGDGFPDLLVRFGRVVYLIEAKDAKGTLTDAQKRFWRDFEPVCVIIRSADEAREFALRLRAEQAGRVLRV